MIHKEHKPFTETTFKQLCDSALRTLPKHGTQNYANSEEASVFVLKHLLKELQNYCGVEDGFSFEDLTGFPRSLQLMQKIIGIVDFDLVHEHPTMVFFYKQPIIEAYVRKAVGQTQE